MTGYDERVEVLGSSGMVESMPHRVRRVTHHHSGAAVESHLPAGWFERMQPTYALALEHFVESLETGAPLEPSLSDGLKAQATAEAATTSLHTGVSERSCTDDARAIPAEPCITVRVTLVL